jgi:phosphoserine aminotransferase
MMNPTYNFNAGPAMLPPSVKELQKEAIDSFDRAGRGILEIGHRTSDFAEVLQETKEALRDLLSLPEEFSLYFITGGATNQFSMVPMNIIRSGESADYLLTGVWAEKAYNEARRLRAATIAASSQDKKYSFIPRTISQQKEAIYLHFTSNNTIAGTQFKNEPGCSSIPLVCDASSDILAKTINLDRYGLIYACAQKNLGIAGVTLVIARKSFALRNKEAESLPILMQYKTFDEHDSMYNTPPVFAIYTVFLMAKWIKSQGGVSAFERMNEEKANLIYRTIDEGDFYRGSAHLDDRSNVNIAFRLSDPDFENHFLQEAEKEGFFGLKGHKLVGGLRASMYNAFPLSGAQALASFMHEYAKRRA